MKPNILLFWLVLPTKVWLVRGLQSVNKKKDLKRFNYFNWDTPVHHHYDNPLHIFKSKYMLPLFFQFSSYPIFGFFGDTER